MEKISIKKGLTLIEVNLALVIFMILLAIVSPFFYSNFKSLNEADIRLELQRKGEKILEDINKKALEASGIEELKDKNNVKEITFKYEDGSKYTWKNHYENGIKVKLLPEGSNEEKAKGINIELTLKKKKVEEKLSTDVYFRNYNEQNKKLESNEEGEK
ncbi:type II secretion system protein [Clostridium massiliodielmoense]|uniref:type II secretion system protein n=1 Tax=Clostridium massiliodielmoense TaxID=1776385 RepID=UPI000A26A0F9|nr:prepilin-type N-terminal cleavage/methylation domain-containing protein [Clostridium massiliodielmoense]